MGSPPRPEPRSSRLPCSPPGYRFGAEIALPIRSGKKAARLALAALIWIKATWGDCGLMSKPPGRQQEMKNDDPSDPGKTDGPARPGTRLLLVEDDPTIAAAAYQKLTGEAHIVDIASTASAARAAIDNDAYDLVILDLSLPDADGMELLQHWRRSGRGVAIIVVTARAGIEDKVQGLDSGADDYLTKPFEMEELLASVRAALRRRANAGDQMISFANLELDTVRR